MTYHFFTDQQTETDLLALLKQYDQETRLDAAQQDQNWLDVYEDDPALILPAAAALSFHALKADGFDPMLVDVWDAATPHLPPARHPTRAAFANAFVLLAQRQTAPEWPRFHKLDLISQERADVEAGLLPLARTVCDFLEPISQADYGDLANEHRRALEDMLARDFKKFPYRDRWVPMEVISLVSHTPNSGGHIPALAILLLEAVRNGDFHGNVEFRWQDQKDDILAMPSAVRDPFLVAFRHLHELECAEHVT